MDARLSSGRSGKQLWEPAGPHLRDGGTIDSSTTPAGSGAFTRSKMSVSGPVGIGGFEEGEFEADSPTEKFAAQIRRRGADPVQLRAQEIDEVAKIRIVVERDPLGMHEVVR